MLQAPLAIRLQLFENSTEGFPTFVTLGCIFNFGFTSTENRPER